MVSTVREVTGQAAVMYYQENSKFKTLVISFYSQIPPKSDTVLGILSFLPENIIS